MLLPSVTAALHDHVEDRTNRTEGALGARGRAQLTLGLFVLLLLLLSALWLLRLDRAEAVEVRGCTPPGRPTAGEMDRTGTFGGGPGSAPGERRKERCEGPGACIVVLNCSSSAPGARRCVSVDGFGARDKETGPIRGRKRVASVSLYRRLCAVGAAPSGSRDFASESALSLLSLSFSSGSSRLGTAVRIWQRENRESMAKLN